jgi:hypothetical protein
MAAYRALTIWDPLEPNAVVLVTGASGGVRVGCMRVERMIGRLRPGVIDTVGELGKISLAGELAGPVPNFSTGKFFSLLLPIGAMALGSHGEGNTRCLAGSLVRTGAVRSSPVADRRVSVRALAGSLRTSGQGRPNGKVLLNALKLPRTVSSLPSSWSVPRCRARQSTRIVRALAVGGFHALCAAGVPGS